MAILAFARPVARGAIVSVNTAKSIIADVHQEVSYPPGDPASAFTSPTLAVAANTLGTLLGRHVYLLLKRTEQKSFLGLPVD